MDKPLVQERRDGGSHVIDDGFMVPNIAKEMTNNGNKFVAAVASASNRSYKLGSSTVSADAATLCIALFKMIGFFFSNLSGTLLLRNLPHCGVHVAFLDKTVVVIPADKAGGLQ
jgi:hypothetical protein